MSWCEEAAERYKTQLAVEKAMRDLTEWLYWLEKENSIGK